MVPDGQAKQSMFAFSFFLLLAHLSVEPVVAVPTERDEIVGCGSPTVPTVLDVV